MCRASFLGLATLVNLQCFIGFIDPLPSREGHSFSSLLCHLSCSMSRELDFRTSGNILSANHHLESTPTRVHLAIS